MWQSPNGPGGDCHREYHREYSWRGSTARVLSWQAWRGFAEFTLKY